MISSIRNSYNGNFSPEKYQKFLNAVTNAYGHTPPFRLAETPVFVPTDLKNKLIAACEEIADVICREDFKELTSGAFHDPSIIVPKEDKHTTFLQMDFGICLDENGQPTPKLIETQGFPSLYFFQILLSEAYQAIFDLPKNLTTYLGGITKEQYVALLKEVIVGETDPKQVIILEIEPEKQATRIDFLVTEHYLGIKTLCLSNVEKIGRKLYYKDERGERIEILKIYNRVIFDELEKKKGFKAGFEFTDDIDAEWIGHPNWFFRISKYTMPFISSQYVPKTYFLNELNGNYPHNLSNFVLKPLYSFAGSGVVLNVTSQDLDAIENKSNYILQEKVKYEPVVVSPNEPVKFEIRMLMIWPKNDARPRVINNLIRLSKGEMIGVRFNKDKDWVGASVGFFEQSI